MYNWANVRLKWLIKRSLINRGNQGCMMWAKCHVSNPAGMHSQLCYLVLWHTLQEADFPLSHESLINSGGLFTSEGEVVTSGQMHDAWDQGWEAINSLVTGTHGFANAIDGSACACVSCHVCLALGLTLLSNNANDTGQLCTVLAKELHWQKGCPDLH